MKVLVEFETLQKDKNTLQTNNIKYTTSAIIKYGKNNDIVAYDEEEKNGLKGTKTILKINDNSITMIRYGQNASNMYFKENFEHRCSYKTQYGEFELIIFTKKLQIQKDIQDNIYNINIDYDLLIQNLFDAINNISINIKKC